MRGAAEPLPTTPARLGPGQPRLRATHVHARAARYRRSGGPWDGPSLDAVLSAAAAAPSASRRTLLVDLSVRAGPLRFTGGEVEARVARLAGGLRAAGVRRHDAVAWQLPNWHEAHLLYRACWRLGAVAVPIHHLAGEAELDHLLQIARPVLGFAASDLPLAHRPTIVPVRGVGGGSFDLIDGAPIMPGAGAGAARPTDLAAVLFTSGSTGSPKAVLHSQRGLAWKARLMTEIHGLGAGDAVLMPAPMAHISGLLNGVLVPGAVPMTTVLVDRWDPEQAVEVIERERISFMIGPPTFFLGLMNANGFSAERVASLRLVSSGGAGVSPAFVETATDALGATVKRTYGSTEAPTIATTPSAAASTGAAPFDHARAVETDGLPTGEVEIRIGDPVTLRPCPTGTSGEVWVRGPELFVGYADASQTAAAHTRGWYRTGDLGRVDGQGWLTVVGRIKDVIIRGGENISAAEVEAHLEAHPQVRQAVAVGEPDERLGEKVCAFVVTVPGAAFDLETCRGWFAGRGVTRFKTPERLVTLDALPLLPAGKPDRAALRAIAAGTRLRAPTDRLRPWGAATR